MSDEKLVCGVCNKELTDDEAMDFDYPSTDDWRCINHKELWAYSLGQYPGVYEIVRCHPNNSGGDYRKRSDVDPLIADLKQHIAELEAQLAQAQVELRHEHVHVVNRTLHWERYEKQALEAEADLAKAHELLGEFVAAWNEAEANEWKDSLAPDSPLTVSWKRAQALLNPTQGEEDD